MKKTPLSYYGGKQKLAKYICSLLPRGRYTQYVEPFAGGAAVFWAKGKEKGVSETLNDKESTVVNFWEVCGNPVLFPLLAEMIGNTLHHRTYHEESKAELKKWFGNSDLRTASDTEKLTAAWALCEQSTLSFANKLMNGFAFSGTSHVSGIQANNTANKASRYSIRHAADAERVKLAHALYLQCVMSFGRQPMSGFAFSGMSGNEGIEAQNTANKTARFRLPPESESRLSALTSGIIAKHEDAEIAEMKALFAQAEPVQIEFKNEIHDRMKAVTFFNIDAVELIDKKDNDSAATFFEIDPPYPESDCGHYKGYTMDDFRTLLERLENLRKDSLFMLHNYPSDMLREFAHRNNWSIEDIEMNRSAAHSKDRDGDRKTEVIVRNYSVGNDNQTSLF